MSSQRDEATCRRQGHAHLWSMHNHRQIHHRPMLQCERPTIIGASIEHGRVHCQGMHPRGCQAHVDRAPGCATVRALEHATAIRPGIERVGVHRVNRQGIDPAAYGTNAGPGIEFRQNGGWLAEAQHERQQADQ